MKTALISRQFFHFLLAGGVAASVNFASRILYSQWLGYSAAIVFAYLTGMVTAFALNRMFVFKQSGQNWHRSVLMFTLVNALAVAQTWAISVVLAYYILPALRISTFAPEIAHAVGIVVPVFSSYWGHKRWSFRKQVAKSS